MIKINPLSVKSRRFTRAGKQYLVLSYREVGKNFVRARVANVVKVKIDGKEKEVIGDLRATALGGFKRAKDFNYRIAARAARENAADKIAAAMEV